MGKSLVGKIYKSLALFFVVCILCRHRIFTPSFNVSLQYICSVQSTLVLDPVYEILSGLICHLRCDFFIPINIGDIYITEHDRTHS